MALVACNVVAAVEDVANGEDKAILHGDLVDPDAVGRCYGSCLLWVRRAVDLGEYIGLVVGGDQLDEAPGVCGYTCAAGNGLGPAKGLRRPRWRKIWRASTGTAMCIFG
jgi:hypothetical protein